MAATERRDELREFAPAKINLFLHVLGKRADGYHELDSLVVFADVGDHLTATPAHEWGISITGPFAEGLGGEEPTENLVLKAAGLAERWAKDIGKELPPLHFTLEKHLPVASGIGGGSADAAAALRLCGTAAGFAPNSRHYFDDAAQLGADVPACLYSHPVWVAGIGEVLRPALITSRFGVLLVNPGVEISTADVFARLAPTHVRPPRDDRPNLLSLDDLVGFLKPSANDLEAPARTIAPVIGTVLDEIEKTAPLLARMSGSGATCFGIYSSRDEADAAAHQIRETHHDWWVMAAEPVRA